jgi:tRNA/rRNA methyltransferase
VWSDYPVEVKERIKLLMGLRVVLVSAKFAGNIGMSARAMRNCGLSDLRLVAPRAELNKEAYQLAPSASEILDTARIHDTLLDAVGDCGLVIGTTRRRGVARRNMVAPEEAADMIRPALLVNRAALVFGPEDTGLSNDDLALCHWTVSMSTGSGAESFNLSHAVAIMLYLVNRAVIELDRPRHKLATSANLEAMFADLSRYLVETGFIVREDPRRMVTVMRKILHRAALSDRDVKIIRGVLRQSRWRIKNPDAPLIPRDRKVRVGSRKRKPRQGVKDE